MLCLKNAIVLVFELLLSDVWNHWHSVWGQLYCVKQLALAQMGFVKIKGFEIVLFSHLKNLGIVVRVLRIVQTFTWTRLYIRLVLKYWYCQLVLKYWCQLLKDIRITTDLRLVHLNYCLPRRNLLITRLFWIVFSASITTARKNRFKVIFYLSSQFFVAHIMEMGSMAFSARIYLCKAIVDWISRLLIIVR